MAYESNFVSFVGNLATDPELRFLGDGTPVTTFRIATNRTYRDKNGDEQEESTFIGVTAWRDLGEHVAESLDKGDRAVVLGRLRVRPYETDDGETRRVTEIVADEVAPSLRYTTAEPRRGARTGKPDQQSSPPPMDDVPF